MYSCFVWLAAQKIDVTGVGVGQSTRSEADWVTAFYLPATVWLTPARQPPQQCCHSSTYINSAPNLQPCAEKLSEISLIRRMWEEGSSPSTIDLLRCKCMKFQTFGSKSLPPHLDESEDSLLLPTLLLHLDSWLNAVHRWSWRSVRRTAGWPDEFSFLLIQGASQQIWI